MRPPTPSFARAVTLRHHIPHLRVIRLGRIELVFNGTFARFAIECRSWGIFFATRTHHGVTFRSFR